jgi:hypothetical protein
MKMNYKKSTKLIVLLVSSLLIAFASATTYSELFMHATPISIGTADLIFTPGGNTTTMGGGDAINTAATEVTFDSIPAVKPGETRTYEQAVNITNNAGSTKTINMSVYSLTGQFTNNFDYINITIFDAAGTKQGSSVEIVSSGTNVTETGPISMANGLEWTIKWIIKAKIDATNGQSTSVTLRMKVED